MHPSSLDMLKCLAHCHLHQTNLCKKRQHMLQFYSFKESKDKKALSFIGCAINKVMTYDIF